VCIVSDFSWFMRFVACVVFVRYKLLIGKPHKEHPTAASQSVHAFLDALNASPTPFPGESFEVRANTFTSVLDGTHTLTRGTDDDLPTPHHLHALFTSISTHNIITIFQALLEERRVLICGDTCSQVAETIFALHSLLFPFKWSHISVPILPRSLIDYVMAPMPFIIGVHTSFLTDILRMPLEETLLVNLTNQTINIIDQSHQLRPPEKTSLPNAHSFYMNIHEKLPLQQNHIFDAPALQEVFLHYLLDIFGSYRKFITVHPESSLPVFQEHEFFTHNTQHTTLLKKMRESQLFEQWLRERLMLFEEGIPPSGRFEMACAHRYPEEYNLVISSHNEHESALTEGKEKGAPRFKRWAQGLLNKVSGASSKHMPVIQHRISKSPTLQRMAHESVHKLSHLQKRSSDALSTYTNRFVLGKRPYTFTPTATHEYLKSRRNFSSSRNSTSTAHTAVPMERPDPLAELKRHKRENSLLSEEEKVDLHRDATSSNQPGFANSFVKWQTQVEQQMVGLFMNASEIQENDFIDDDEVDLMDFEGMGADGSARSDHEQELLLDLEEQDLATPQSSNNTLFLSFDDDDVSHIKAPQGNNIAPKNIFEDDGWGDDTDLFSAPMVNKTDVPAIAPRASSISLDDLFSSQPIALNQTSTNAHSITLENDFLNMDFDLSQNSQRILPTMGPQAAPSGANTKSLSQSLLDLDPFG